MAINFPDSPNNGDSFTSNNKTWVFDGTVWNITSGTNSVADGAITAAKIASNAVHQTKLASNLSAITVTTTANRGTAVPSPFTGQTIYLSDVKRLQVWDGSAWMFITNGAPGAPTALSATPLSTTSVSISFTTGTINGASPTNYKYAYSSNGGSTYTEFASLDPADALSPIVVSGLTGSTAYLIKLRAVSDFGDSVDSSAVSVTTLTAPSAPTSLSATGYLQASRITFTPGADGGSALTNYEYALSTNSGATYGSWTALSPADTTSPIDITGLANNTTYYIKLRAVSTAGAGAESSAVTITTNQNIPVDYLVVAGGGGGGKQVGGGGGAGGYLENYSFFTLSTNYSVTIGAGGAAADSTDGQRGKDGSNSVCGLITSTGGGGGGGYSGNSGRNGGSGGGADGGGPTLIGLGTAGQGNNGGQGFSSNWAGGGGGGAGGVGVNATAGFGGNGGIGKISSISGSSTYYAGGGGGCSDSTNAGSSGGLGGGGNGRSNAGNGDQNGVANRGGGGGGIRDTGTAGAGGSGIIILSYSSTKTITLGAGLTGSTSTVGANKVTTITAGSGNVSWS